MSAKRMERFYRKLLSGVWTERLDAYERIAGDLKALGCKVMIENRWVDAKLLVGQIVSIHFKRRIGPCVLDFEERLKNFYRLLLAPLKSDTSDGYAATRQLLTDIYDDDDTAAHNEIREFFAGKSGGVSEEKSVLENLLLCYAAMMRRVQERSAALLSPMAAMPA